MKNLRIILLTLIFVITAAAIVAVAVFHRGRSTVNASSYDEVAALDDALKNGLISQDDYDAKLEGIGAHDPQSKPHTDSPAAGALKVSSRLKTVEIQDPAWGITAFRMQIPEDWSFEGVLIRDQGCGFTPTVAFRASSPDGLSGTQMMPQFGSHWSDDPTYLQIFRRFQCKLEKPMEPEAFIKFLAPIARPNPVIGEIKPTLDAAQWQRNIDQFNQRAGGGPAPAHMTGGAVRSRITYGWHGHDLEEVIAVRMMTTQQSMGGYGGPQRSSWTTVAYVSTMRAPKGHLDELSNAIGPAVAKGGFTDEWMQRSAQKMQQDSAAADAMIRKQGDDMRNMFARNHQEYMQAQQASYQKHNAQWREHIDTMDRSAKAYSLYAGDEQLVRNSQTGAVSQVTNQYGNHGWQDQTSNQILMTNDPNVNPNLYLRGTWTQLENVNPLQP